MCMEMPRIELGASYMQSMRSTTELHPLYIGNLALQYCERNWSNWTEYIAAR